MVFQSLNLFPHLSVLDDCVLAQRRLNIETKFIIKESPCFIGVKFGEMPMLQWVNVFILHKKLGGRLNAMSQKWFG